MKRTLGLAAASIALAVATIAYAQGNVIEERQNFMKANGAAMGLLTQMARGEAPFDEAAAKEAFQGIATRMETFPTLFPAGSDTGDTKAGPAIWTDTAGFEATAASIVTAATAAAAASTSLEALQASVGTVGAVCGECHQKYRNN
jgi:cytochrome c556